LSANFSAEIGMTKSTPVVAGVAEAAAAVVVVDAVVRRLSPSVVDRGEVDEAGGGDS
jgi:hypothetical protein